MKKFTAADMFESMGYVDGAYIEEAEADKNTRRRPRVSKAARIILIAAVITALMTVTAFAVSEYRLNSPEQALAAAVREVEQMKNIGILEPAIELDTEKTNVLKLEEQDLGVNFFHRIIYPSYHILNRGGKYTIAGQLDMATGKLGYISINADGIFDIISEGLSLDELCGMMAEYWGYTGYTLSGTKDSLYGWDTEAPDSSTEVKDICDGPYITVYFEGDQPGVPMYIELYSLPDAMVFTIGMHHMEG